MGQTSREAEASRSRQDGLGHRRTLTRPTLAELDAHSCLFQDLDEIEEWNEYGELKEHIDVPQAAAITPGTSANVTPMNTPSKAPTVQAVHEKTKLSTQSSSEPVPKPSLTPLTDAMRRLGEEAAKKAGEKKPNSLMRASQAKDAEKAPMETRTIPNDGAVVPAPSGTIEQTSATPGNSLAQAAAEDEESEAPAPQPSSLSDSGTSPAELDVSLAKDAPVSRYGGSNVSTASPDVIKDLEERLAIAEESEEDSEAGAGHPEDASEEERSKLSLSKAQQRTQDQPAADENLAAASVDD